MGLLRLITPKPKSKDVERVFLPPSIQAQKPDEEYLKLADRLGVTVRPQQKTLDDVLRAEMIRIYPMKSVRRYMDRQTPRGKVWVWTFAREKDRATMYHLLKVGSERNGQFAVDVYNRPIPFPVLLTMEKVAEAAYAADVTPAFFVTDYAVRMPDPFLMVTFPGADIQYQIADGRLWTANGEPDCFVIERWDEPSFR